MTRRNPIVIGDVFGQLTVLRISKRQHHFVCRCSCGTEKDVRKDHLRGGKIISCGCYKAKTASQRAYAGVMTAACTKHGASKTRAYTVWLGMRQRCNNPNSPFYSYYGGRGIHICERWQQFENFLSDMGQPGSGQELDRLDNDKGYSPENCAWRSREDQQNNRRVNRRVTFNNETHTIAQWSRLTGIHHNTITQRLDNGLSPERAFSQERVDGHASTLTPEQVRTIRNSNERGYILARTYNVTQGTIWAVRNRKSWKNLPD